MTGKNTSCVRVLGDDALGKKNVITFKDLKFSESIKLKLKQTMKYIRGFGFSSNHYIFTKISLN